MRFSCAGATGSRTRGSPRGRARLTLMELAVPVTRLQIRKRYSELALRWHPDRNRSAQAHEQMTALNRAIELLTRIDAKILASENGASSGRDGGIAFRHDGQFIMPSEFDEGLTTDWI
jgi:DnaJ-class molecular chaperone